MIACHPRIAAGWLSACLGLVLVLPSARAEFDFERAPIFYRDAPANNAVARLEEKLRSGEVQLVADERGSYLRSLLEALDIPISSQTLVFSKTSLQQNRIAPDMPRAVYFNDDCYVAWVQGGLIELGVMDEHLGGVFYTLRDGSRTPSLQRDRGGCIACHASGRTQQVPGFFIRSVFPDEDGRPRGFGTVSDHRSPFEQRWGGWYVTGSHGQMRHLGNELATDPDDDEKIDLERGANLVSLDHKFSTRRYLSPHSDLVALMVMEHQSQMHNYITVAHYETVQATTSDQVMNEALGRPADYRTDSTQRRIAKAGDQLVEYLLYCDEAPLHAEISGTSTFTEEFAARGPFDSQGRSLRQFDLRTRMFRYPCSYLIYSPAFDSLPEPMAQYVRTRLLAVLRGEDSSERFKHLSTADRQAILEILAETKPSLFESQPLPQ